MSTRLWYDRFVDDWMNALPLGNGRVGAMLYGNPHCEQIEINEESLWSGKQLKEENHATPETLAKIRELIFEERLQEAAQLSRETFLATPPRVRFFESFGEIFIDYADKSEYTNYHKELELNDAVASVKWTKGDVNYESECFVSEEYDIFAYRVKADKAFDCNVTLKRKQDAYSGTITNDTLIMNGRIIYESDPNYGEGGEGMSFGALMKVKSDGELKREHDRITVKNATYLVIYSAFATNYNVQTFDFDENIDYRAIIRDQMSKVENLCYCDVKAKHIEDHQKWFCNVKFELDAPVIDEPTDIRLKMHKEGGKDLDLYTLYYNFGRYLLIESSGKKATLPANLQGIWCHDFRPPWGSDYHTNINLQMNYWPAEIGNCSKAVAPLTHYMKMISKFGEQTAKDLFNADGWTINHTSDVFGRTGIHDSVDCGFFPMAGPWMCLPLWEHYEHTNDIEYLKEIYPILKGSCKFVCDYLVEAKDGTLVAAPSNSPENSFYYTEPDGTRHRSMFTQGATIDAQIIYALFTRTLHAYDYLGENDGFCDKLNAVLAKLPPMRIGERYNTICEWIKDYEECEPGHRHVSHLFALHPSDQINEDTPELFAAAKRTIARRIENGGGATGWSRAWTVNFYARLKDGDGALFNLRNLLSNCTAENMFDIHPPFQIDGNFGGTAGIMEMLLQSHRGTPDNRIIDLIPSLPSEWKNGSISGIISRGGFIFDLTWKDCKLTEVTVKATTAKKLNLGIPAGHSVPTADKAFENRGSVISFDLAKDETVKLIFA